MSRTEVFWVRSNSSAGGVEGPSSIISQRMARPSIAANATTMPIAAETQPKRKRLVRFFTCPSLGPLLAGVLARVLNCLPHALRRGRHLDVAHAERPQRIHDGVH